MVSSGLDALQFFFFGRNVLRRFLLVHQLVPSFTARLWFLKSGPPPQDHDRQQEAEQPPAHEDHLQTQKPAHTNTQVVIDFVVLVFGSRSELTCDENPESSRVKTTEPAVQYIVTIASLSCCVAFLKRR